MLGMDRLSLLAGAVLVVVGLFALANSFLQLAGVAFGFGPTNIGAFTFLAAEGALLLLGGLAVMFVALRSVPGQNSDSEKGT
ncbi:MAG: hypothetical protein ACE5KH_05990 [Candidatus Geothermarchaeales archaeon]